MRRVHCTKIKENHQYKKKGKCYEKKKNGSSPSSNLLLDGDKIERERERYRDPLTCLGHHLGVVKSYKSVLSAS